MSKELDDINYIKRKRDIELDRFVSKVESGAPMSRIESTYNSLIKFEKQMRLMEDALVIHRVQDGKRD